MKASGYVKIHKCSYRELRQWNHTDCEEAQVSCLWTDHLFSQLSETPSLSSGLGSALLFSHSCSLEVNDGPPRQMSAKFCSVLQRSTKCGVHWLLCCGFLCRHIASYPSQGRAPWLWELWWEFLILKGFVPKTRTAEPSEFRIIGPMNHYTAAEFPPLQLEFSLWSSSALSSYVLHYLWSLCFHPFLFFAMTIHGKKTTLVSFLFFVVNNFKFKFWGD